MSREDTERMADGIVRLRDEILRRREPDAEGGAVELTPAQGAALRAVVRLGQVARLLDRPGCVGQVGQRSRRVETVQVDLVLVDAGQEQQGRAVGAQCR